MWRIMDNMHTLEQYEWSNIWCENANDGSLPRVMMVGDSISVGYRGAVAKNLAGKAYTDTYSTSKALDNPCFLPELDLVAAGAIRAHSVITFNNGLHGMHLSAAEYEKYAASAIGHIVKKYESAKLIIVLSTPITENGDPHTLAPLNSKPLERNEIMRSLAAKYKLQVCDLYAAVAGNAGIRSADGYHYNSDGYKIMADALSAAIAEDL